MNTWCNRSAWAWCRRRSLGLLTIVPGLLVAAPAPTPAPTATGPIKVRLKDVCRLAGAESQTLVGYGLVVGLAGTGDSDEELTQRTIANLLQNFNLTVDLNNVKAKNSAAVMVTLTVDRPAHAGERLSGTVSSLGDATALAGGELLLTPLLGPDGTTWATAQGAVNTGSYQFGDSGRGGETQTKNHPTTGRLVESVTLLKDIGLDPVRDEILTVCLEHPDSTTAVNLAEAVNERFIGSAQAEDSATVRVRVPRIYLEESRVMEFIRAIESVEFVPDQVARIVFNERTGTMVFGSNVRISSVAISHGNLSVTIKNTEGVSQPEPFSPKGSATTVTNDQTTTVREERTPVHLLPAVTTVGDLVSVLNALGVTPRDIIVIMHALKAAGALHAEIQSL